jgi:hypothetical protein
VCSIDGDVKRRACDGSALVQRDRPIPRRAPKSGIAKNDRRRKLSARKSD